MNTESTEHLSSLMDGEVSRETGRFLVRRLGADGELRKTWARYHLIRDCLRHQDGLFARSDLSNKVQNALSGESPEPVRFDFGNMSWVKPVAGIAIAASVALIAVLTVSREAPTGPSTLDREVVRTEIVKPFASPNMSRLTPETRPVNLSGNSGPGRQKMNAYLLRHFQMTEEAGGGRGFVSFVPIVVSQTATGGRSGYDGGVKEIETGSR